MADAAQLPKILGGETKMNIGTKGAANKACDTSTKEASDNECAQVSEQIASTARIGAKSIQLSAFGEGYGYTAVMMLALPLSINYILNGNSATSDGDSQGFYAICFFLKQIASVLFASMVGELGNAIGRKRIVHAVYFAHFSCITLSLLAIATEFVLFHALALFVLGVFTPFNPNGMSYLLDVSPKDDLNKNLGSYSGLQWGSFFVGFLIALITFGALSDKPALITQYVIAAIVVFLANAYLLARLPDISPSKEKRGTFCWKKGIPLYMLAAVSEWTGYMRLAYSQLVLGPGAAYAAQQAYMINYAIKRYGATEVDCALLLLLGFFLASVFGKITLHFMPIKYLIPFTYGGSLIGALLYILTPSEKVVLWILCVFGSLFGAQMVGLQTVFLAQVSETERGTLAGALSSGDALGRVFGSLIGGVIGSMWVSSESLQQSFPGLPVLAPFSFQSLAFLCYVTGEVFYGSKNKLNSGTSDEPSTELPDDKNKLNSGTSNEPSTEPPDVQSV